MFLRRLIIAVVYNVVIFCAILFGVAGTWHWWRAWVFIGVVVAATVVIMLTVFRDRPELLNERFKGVIQRGQPRLDRLIMVLFLVGYSGLLIFTPFDVFRFHLLAKPGIVISSLGLVFVVAGYWIVALAFMENTFAVPVIKHQKERQHVVVDTGLYGIVRHPMYTGLILLLLGMPLWLESYAAALVAIFPIALLMLRILVEERFLRRELPGYEAYTERIRYRLAPLVW
ncbi:MAG: isoprenylcysteine carboxylmethyltransferase family protein [Pirellulales bacterium]